MTCGNFLLESRLVAAGVAQKGDMVRETFGTAQRRFRTENRLGFREMGFINFRRYS